MVILKGFVSKFWRGHVIIEIVEHLMQILPVISTAQVWKFGMIEPVKRFIDKRASFSTSLLLLAFERTSAFHWQIRKE